MIVQRRGKNIALTGAVVQALLAAAMMVDWQLTGSQAAMACTWFLASGVLVWLMAALLFYCRQLERRESLEAEETSAGAPGSAIFERSELDLRAAANRLRFIERWVSPSFTLGWALIQVACAVLLYRSLVFRQAVDLDSELPGAILSVAVAFVGFLFSRYSIGMSERAEWRLLRATGSYLTVNILAAAAVTLAMITGWYEAEASGGGANQVDRVLALVLPALQIILAAELLLNFVLELYRPRVPGQEVHYSFDSRLYNLVAQPGRVGHSLAEAINYQFGFEVSKTWFFQLAMRAFVPMLLFGAIALMAISSILIVENGEDYVISHLGRKDRVVSRGMHLKLPWPFETAERYQGEKIHSVLLGVGQPRSEAEREKNFVHRGNVDREVYLWGQEHGMMEERDFLIAAPRDPSSKAPPVNLIKLVVNVQFEIPGKSEEERAENLSKFIKYEDGDKLMECIASREMVRYCAMATLDRPAGEGASDRPEAIMTYGREKAARELERRIQRAADEMQMGVRVTSVGLQAVHPPKEASADYEKVLEAERKQDVDVFNAEADANKALTEVAGDPLLALQLALAIRKMGELESLRAQVGNPKAFDAKLKDLLAQVQDDIDKKYRVEIDRERLLGRLQAEVNVDTMAVHALQPGGSAQLTMRQQLLLDHLQYRATLQKILADDKDVGMKQRQEWVDQAIADASSAKKTDGANYLLDHALGQPATLVAQAQAKRLSGELGERSKAETFQRNLMAYRACPKVYLTDRWLDVWDEVLPGMTKYLLAAERKNLEIWLDWTQQTAPMADVSFGEKETKKP